MILANFGLSPLSFGKALDHLLLQHFSNLSCSNALLLVSLDFVYNCMYIMPEIVATAEVFSGRITVNLG